MHKTALLSRKSDKMTPQAEELPTPSVEEAPTPPPAGDAPPLAEEAPPEGSTEPESAEARPFEEATLTKEEEDKLLKVGSLTLVVWFDVYLTHYLRESTYTSHSFAASSMGDCRTFMERSGRLTGTTRSIAS